MAESAPDTGSIYTVRDLSFAYGKLAVLDRLSFSIARGKVTTLMGANGCGKSTLFKLLTKNLKATGGALELDGRLLGEYRLGELAKKVAVVWQHNTAPYDITVRQLVAYGRIPHKHHFQSLTHADEAAIERAIDFCDLGEVATRRVSELSGGQQQRVWIALGLAQEAPVMFLDEPTTYLDIQYQVKVLRLIRKLNRDLGMTVVLILHDVNQTLAISDELIALRRDGQLVQGSPRALIDEEFLRGVFNTDLRIGALPSGGSAGGSETVVYAPL